MCAAALLLGACVLAQAQEASPAPSASAVAQSSALTPGPGGDLHAVLEHAALQASLLGGSLPNFTCKVSGHSQSLHQGHPEEDVPFEGIIRAVREPDGRMAETNTFTTVNGKPYKPGKRRPYFVHGGFAAVLSYVSRAQQVCSAFTLTAPHRVEFAARTPPPVGCARWSGLKGWFAFDDEGNVTHIERSLPPTEGMDLFVSYASVDLQPVELKDKIYWLASHLLSDNVEGDDTMRFEANYSECRFFTTEIRIHPGSAPVDESGERLPASPARP